MMLFSRRRLLAGLLLSAVLLSGCAPKSAASSGSESGSGGSSSTSAPAGDVSQTPEPQPEGSGSSSETGSDTSQVQTPEGDGSAGDSQPANAGKTVPAGGETQPVSGSASLSGYDFSQPCPESPAVDNSYFEDAAFIGDSRTVGLSEYAGLPATFFADVGMTVYSAFDKEISVAGVGKVTLSDLLSQQKFDRIHLMLGINELGYDMDTTVKQYASVLEQIGVLQPDATIYLGANLHVDAARSQSDAIFNNTRINQFNQQVAAMADGKDVIYLDVNPLFDDESGCLRSDLTGDGTHVYGSSYVTWGQWLYEQMQ